MNWICHIVCSKPYHRLVLKLILCLIKGYVLQLQNLIKIYAMASIHNISIFLKYIIKLETTVCFSLSNVLFFFLQQFTLKFTSEYQQAPEDCIPPLEIPFPSHLSIP